MCDSNARGPPRALLSFVRSSFFGYPEVPYDAYDRHDGTYVDEHDVDGHQPATDGPVGSTASRVFRGLKCRRRFAFVTTVTELNAMAAPA